MDLNNEIKLDDQFILEIRREVETLKSIIIAVEEEFKRKGEYKVENHNYTRYGGLFFNAEKYALKTASRIHQQIKKVLKLLKRRFPWTPIKEDVEIVTYSFSDARSRYVTFFNTLSFFETEVTAKPPYLDQPVKQVYRSVSWDENWKKARSSRLIPNLLGDLIDLCEKLNNSEVLRELYKPIFVALAQILHHSGEKFIIDYFDMFKPEILEAALSYGKKEGWITPVGDGTYIIVQKPVIEISCPTCRRDTYSYRTYIPAHIDECPKCGFYIPNIIFKHKRKITTYIPEKWYKYNEKDDEWMAFLSQSYHSTNLSDISISQSISIELFTILMSAIHDLLFKEEYIDRLPNIKHYADYYTDYLFIGNEHHLPDVSYYVIKAKSIENLKDKYNKIIKKIKTISEEEYYKSVDRVKYRSEDLWMDMNEFVNRVFIACKGIFNPPLDEHPIFEEGIEEKIPSTSITIPGLRINGYASVGLVGRGGFSEVYKVRRKVDGKIYAMKIPLVSIYETMGSLQVKSFLKEIEVWKSLDHPNVVKIIDYGFKGVPYLVMEYMEGGSLRERLKKGVDLNFAIKVITEVADALQHAHMRGVIHRDIKPENVLLTGDGKVKVADWGLAKVLLAVSSKSSAEFKGTLIYSTPEQISPEDFGDIDQRTDIYQLGCLSYEILTGQPPYKAENPAKLIYNILNKIPEKTSKLNSILPPKIDDIILKALAKRKEQRFQQVIDMKTELEKILYIRNN